MDELLHQHTDQYQGQQARQHQRTDDGPEIGGDVLGVDHHPHRWWHQQQWQVAQQAGRGLAQRLGHFAAADQPGEQQQQTNDRPRQHGQQQVIDRRTEQLEQHQPGQSTQQHTNLLQAIAPIKQAAHSMLQGAG